MNFIGFPSIEPFHYVVKTAEHFKPGVIPYRGKIKLHGSNCSLRIKHGEVKCQSRTRFVTPEDDNYGFARWVQTRMDFFKSCKVTDGVIFGEWAGPGLCKSSTGISKIPHKVFAIFAVQTVPDNTFVVDSDTIKCLLPDLPTDVHVLPWHDDGFTADFDDIENLKLNSTKLSDHIDELEKCDPWVKSVFGVEGTAEGVVLYPTHGQNISREYFENFAFKAKGMKHKVMKHKAPVQIDPEIAESVEEFTDMFVTENRLEQGLEVIGGKADAKKTGDFLKWMMTDIMKESPNELEASGLTWEQVEKPVQRTVRDWFLAKAKPKGME